MAVAIQGTNPRFQRLLMRLLWYPGKSLPVYCMIVLLILLPDGSCIQAVDVDGLSPLLTTNGYSVGGEAELAEDSLKRLAQKLGSELFRLTKDASGHSEAEQGFRQAGATVEKQDISAHLSATAKKLSKLMADKVAAVKRLVENAEQITEEANWTPEVNISYYNAKDLALNSSTADHGVFSSMEFAQDLRFHDVEVNLTSSTIHVPTNIYNRSPAVLNGIHWSQRLDETFRLNLRNDETLRWQYFGSAEGFMRMYPGIKWPTDPEKPDIYDCRLTNWYIRAASSPKDMIILVDISGSMTGIREEIARTTVKEIMNTLHEDDFFNIITFNDSAQYLEPCLANTLVQASELTKARFAENLESLDTKDIANYTAALTMAFEALNSSSDRTTSSVSLFETGSLLDGMDAGGPQSALCNKAIMIISDGAPENYQDVLKDLNPDQRVRIFTYVIGREVTVFEEMKNIACKNRGYVTHVSSMADVRDQVEVYFRVLGRPMVLSRNHTNIWTSAYWHGKTCISVLSRPVGITSLNSGTGNKGVTTWSSHISLLTTNIGMVMTVAQPVFNRSRAAKKKGSLIGVAGIDVPIADVRTLMTPYRWGTGSYVFGLNHNGHVLFHPSWRTSTTRSNPRHSYNEVDLSEAEFVAETKKNSEDTMERSYELPLRVDMIDQKEGHRNMLVMRQLDERKRVYVKEYLYYYTGIVDTPFSIGIAVPAGMGRPNSDPMRISGRITLDQLDVSTLDFGSNEWVLHPDWSYCNSTVSDVAKLLEVLRANGAKPAAESHFTSEETTASAASAGYTVPITCDMELVESLLFDIHATNKAAAHWSNHAAQKRVAKRHENPIWQIPIEIETVFTATRSGLTRYKNLEPTSVDLENLVDPVIERPTDLGQVEYTRIRRTETDMYSEAEAPDADGDDVSVGKIVNIANPEDHPSENDTTVGLRPFFELHPRAVEESFYERTVSSINEMTITTPLFQASRRPVGSPDESSVMATIPVYVSNQDPGKSILATQTVPVAITGIIIKTRTIKSLLLQLAKDMCVESSGRGRLATNVDNCLSCHHRSVSCFLVDESGYVVTSTRFHDDRGKFFGQIHGEVFRQMLARNITKRVSKSQRVPEEEPCESVPSIVLCAGFLVAFNWYRIFDYQGNCAKEKNKFNNRNSAHPIKTWMNVAVSGVRTLSEQVFNYGVLLLGSLLSIPGKKPAEDSFRFDHTTQEDEDESSENETMTVPPHKCGVTTSWVPCDMEYYLYHSEWTHLKTTFTVSCVQGNCIKRVGVFKVSTTNMLLIAMDKSRACPCNDLPLSTIPVKRSYEKVADVESEEASEEPVETSEESQSKSVGSSAGSSVPSTQVGVIGGKPPEESDNSRFCKKYNQRAYRRRPSDCFPFHEQEDSSDCGAGGLVGGTHSLSLDNGRLLAFVLTSALWLICR